MTSVIPGSPPAAMTGDNAGETIGPGLLRSILSQAGVTVEEFRAVL